jgi:Asp-tRNA(Asn)/Glu-tRNA(Gln) amidotransferase C subunit
MRRQVIGVVALLALLPAAGARGSPDDDKKPQGTPKEQYKAILDEFNEAQKEFLKKYKEAQTPADKQKVLREDRPKPQSYTGRMMKLAAENPKDPAAFDALLWVVTQGGGTADANKATQILTKDYVADPRIGPLVPALASSGPSGERALRELLEKNPDKNVQGQAAFYLAYQMKQQISRGRLDEKEAEAKVAEAEKLFERVIADYGDVKLRNRTLADIAKVEVKGLKNLLNLTVGKVAPEIEGEDVDGQKFKLSDYRGKVVLLDFWGHW